MGSGAQSSPARPPREEQLTPRGTHSETSGRPRNVVNTRASFCVEPFAVVDGESGDATTPRAEDQQLFHPVRNGSRTGASASKGTSEDSGSNSVTPVASNDFRLMTLSPESTPGNRKSMDANGSPAHGSGSGSGSGDGGAVEWDFDSDADMPRRVDGRHQLVGPDTEVDESMLGRTLTFQQHEQPEGVEVEKWRLDPHERELVRQFVSRSFWQGNKFGVGMTVLVAPPATAQRTNTSQSGNRSTSTCCSSNSGNSGDRSSSSTDNSSDSGNRGSSSSSSSNSRNSGNGSSRSSSSSSSSSCSTGSSSCGPPEGDLAVVTKAHCGCYDIEYLLSPSLGPSPNAGQGAGGTEGGAGPRKRNADSTFRNTATTTATVRLESKVSYTESKLQAHGSSGLSVESKVSISSLSSNFSVEVERGADSARRDSSVPQTHLGETEELRERNNDLRERSVAAAEHILATTKYPLLDAKFIKEFRTERPAAETNSNPGPEHEQEPVRGRRKS